MKQMYELEKCKCGSTPHQNKYETGSWFHMTIAKIKCPCCGVCVEIETYHDRDIDKGNVYDNERNQFKRAMLNTIIKWNSMMAN